MISTIKRNDLKLLLPYALRQGKTNEEMKELALNFVNSEERKIIVNSFIVASQNENDLLYIKDLFSNVRIKKGFINSVRFFIIDYATNFSMVHNVYKIDKKINENSITFCDLLLNKKNVDDLEKVTAFYKEINEKRQSRRNREKTVNTFIIKRKEIASKLLANKLSQYQTLKDNNGNDYYIKDNVLYRKNELLEKYHESLRSAALYGYLK